MVSYIAVLMCLIFMMIDELLDLFLCFYLLFAQ